MAAYNLGSMLARQGDSTGAREALQVAIDSNHHDVAPQAAYDMGLLLADLGDLDGALAAFQLSARSTGTDAGRNAVAWIANQQRRQAKRWSWRR
jgi:hypothetical protein